MSSESDQSDSDQSGVIGSFACLTKVKSQTPRARFDIYFHPTSIELIQYSVKKEVSNRYRICEGDVAEMLRLPYSNDKQIFFVLHLKRPIVGGNKSYTSYDFVVFNFAHTDHDEIPVDMDDPLVRDMFEDEDTVESGTIEGSTADILETLLTKVFGKDVTTPAGNYDGEKDAPALRCTFWDNDEHFLYPLDDGFINVWKYCQKLKLKEVKNVRFVRREGRFKTFDFYMYPEMTRAIRRYDWGASKSRNIDCFFLEFKAIDQVYYDGLFAYCNRNKISISTNDFRESASDTDSNASDSEPEDQSPTGTSGSETDSEQLIDDGFDAPDPYLARLKSEKDERDSESGSTDESSGTSEESEESSTPSKPNYSKKSKKATQRRRRKPSKNVIAESNESSSDGSIADDADDSITTRPRKRSLRIDSDDADDSITTGSKKPSLKIDSDDADDSITTGSRKPSLKIDSDDADDSIATRLRKRSQRIDSDDADDSITTGSRKPSLKIHSEDSEDDSITTPSRKRNLRISSDEEVEDEIQSNGVEKRYPLINDSEPE